jgi:uncharacterized protein (DUF305 family)
VERDLLGLERAVEGSLEMGSIVDKYTKDVQIKKMVSKTSEEQKKEVKELKKWLIQH